MTTVVFRFRVADFDAWKQGYERAIAGPLGADLRGQRIWREQDDSNLVLVAEQFDSRELAQAAFEHPDTREAMIADGIDLSSLQLDYVDEVD